MGNAQTGSRGMVNSGAAVMSTYTGAKTAVRTLYGNSECSEAKAGMHQGSALSVLYCYL